MTPARRAGTQRKDNKTMIGSTPPVQQRIRVYHNVARDPAGRPLGMLDGYAPDHPVALVAELHLPTTGVAPMDAASTLATVFRLFNVGDDPEFGTPDPHAIEYRSRGNRSLSVGDVVAVGDRHFACARISWDPIDPPRIEPIRVPGTNPVL
jgi:hypothetical protein